MNTIVKSIEIPYGYCHCGCGQKTHIPAYNKKKSGWIKGIPMRFVNHHEPKTRVPESIEPRFWSKVNKAGSIPVHCPELGACWEWTANKLKAGYGLFAINKKAKSAHRISWEIAYGTIPDDLWVLHKCDNPSCVNPNHLFLGTHQDNVDDKVSKNRQSKLIGENAPGHKLTAIQVEYIRQRYAEGGISMKTLGNEMGISSAQICHIVNRSSWK